MKFLEPGSRRRPDALFPAMLIILAAHAAYHFHAGTPGILLWVCTVANVLIAAGLLLRSRLALGAGTLWAWIGLPLWVAESISLSDWKPTSIALHVGGPLFGSLGVRRLGLHPRSWIGGTATLLGCQAAARIWTDPALNVNAVFHVRPEAAPFFSTVFTYWLGCTAGSVLVLFALNRGLRGLMEKRAGKEAS
jgi:hypothetical protein